MLTPLRIRSTVLGIALLLVGAGTAWAQAPNVTLSASRVEVDAAVTLRARGMPPETVFAFELRQPDGSTRVQEVQSSATGALSTSFRPDADGMWIVRLRGDGVHSIFGLAVTAPNAIEASEGVAEEQAAEEPREEPERAPSGPLPDEVRIDGTDVVALVAGDVMWRLAFPEGSGPVGPLLSDGAEVWVPKGLSLLQVDAATGVVAERLVVPAPLTSLRSDGAELVATATFADGLATELRIATDGVRDPVRFGTDTEAFGWLRAEAGVPDPLDRLDIDPTNPWLYLAAGRDLDRDDAGVEEGTGSRADIDAATSADVDPADAAALAPRDLYELAIARGRTFFDLAGIGAELYALGETNLAHRALDAAFRDVADRGYDPDLLHESDLRRAYRFPLVQLEEALASGDPDAAEFWASWAYLMAGGDVSATRDALRTYAAQLRAQGDRQGASLWSARAGDLLRTRMGALVDRAFVALAGVGWLAVLAVFLSAVLLYATLTAKYWRAQNMQLRHRRESGRTVRPWARWWGIRFFSFTEKIVLVLLLAATLAAGGLATWDQRATLPAVAGSGTLASPPARAFVAELGGDPIRSAFVAGYAAQTAGEPEAARAAYERAGDFAPAVNNIAALTNDERLYQRALELAPGLVAARYNLGRITSPSPFHEAYRPGQPLLVTPSQADLQIAAAGTWSASVADAFLSPWGELRTTAPGIPVYLWTVVLGLFFLIAAAVIVMAVIPRPRVAGNAPRTPLYHLLALLVPGSGLADELWGVLLLAPWSVLALDALLQWTGAGSALGLAFETTLWALGIVYLINLAAFAVELWSYRRRMKELKKQNPDLARGYGLRA